MGQLCRISRERSGVTGEDTLQTSDGGSLASSLGALAARELQGTNNYRVAVEWWYDYLALLTKLNEVLAPL